MHWIDPDCLPETKGKVERFVINPHGEIDGLVLNGGAGAAKLVHVPPHLGGEIGANIQPGDVISVRGVRPRGTDMIAAVALTTSAGKDIVDNGPDEKHRPHKHHDEGEHHDDKPHEKKPKHAQAGAHTRHVEIEGVVKLSLYAPKGELRGALLEGGDIVRIGPKEAECFAELLRPGASIAVRGDGFETAHGRAIEVKEIGKDLSSMKPAKGPKHEK